VDWRNVGLRPALAHRIETRKHGPGETRRRCRHVLSRVGVCAPVRGTRPPRSGKTAIDGTARAEGADSASCRALSIRADRGVGLRAPCGCPRQDPPGRAVRSDASRSGARTRAAVGRRVRDAVGRGSHRSRGRGQSAHAEAGDDQRRFPRVTSIRWKCSCRFCRRCSAISASCLSQSATRRELR
jgi:hypothetical protein